MGGYPGSNRELTVPHTVVLPIELYPPLHYYYYLYLLCWNFLIKMYPFLRLPFFYEKKKKNHSV